MRRMREELVEELAEKEELLREKVVTEGRFIVSGY
jgi:hypothetical protein